MDEISSLTAETVEKQIEPLIKNAPADCTDIAVNPDGSVFAYTHGGKIHKLKCPLDERTLTRISVMLASLSGSSLNAANPVLSAILPKRKLRMEILIPPAVEKTSISIRLQNKSFFSLEALKKMEMMTDREEKLLKKFISERKNIIIAGETGSGKTTLLNALVNEIDNNQRLIIIEEETREIYCKNENTVSITTDRNHFTGRAAVMSALRMNPDRIIYGESRDGESALETLKAWRTGHSGGIATIHASSASGIKDRLSDLLSEVCTGDMRNLIDSAVDVGIFIGFENNRRKILEITEFKKSKCR